MTRTELIQSIEMHLSSYQEGDISIEELRSRIRIDINDFSDDLLADIKQINEILARVRK